MTRVRRCFQLCLMLLLGTPLAAQAQTGSVVGRVFDTQTMRPLSGVVLSVGDVSALSNESGRFTLINVPVGAQVVEAQIIGYTTARVNVEVSAGEAVAIDIRMVSEALQLATIVVTGYGETTEDDLTGVVEAVSAEEFNPGRVVSAEELIQGKVSGVQIYDTGEPGGGMSIRIRGGTSIASSNEPLIVVDGIPLAVGGGISTGRNPLNFINPNDIESVTVLKDASAAAIYGSRGANGVILIETKKGTAGEGAGASFQYVGNVSNMAIDNQVDILAADQYRQVFAGYDQTNTTLGGATTDWQDLIQRNGLGQEHNIAVTGGGRTSSYRVSLGYLEQEGVIRNAETERLTASVSLSQLLLNDRLNLEFNARGSRTTDLFQPSAVIGDAAAMAPTQPVFDADSEAGFWEWEDVLGPNNPEGALQLEENEGTVYRSIGGLRVEAELPWVAGLSLTSNLGYDVTRTENLFFAPSIMRQQAESGQNGTVSRSNGTSVKTTFDTYLDYGLPVGESSDLDITVGYSWEDFRSDFPSFFAEGLSFDLLGPNGVPTAELQQTRIDVQENRLISFFSRVNYSISDKYLFTGSIRRDGSSRFGPDEQWGIFPSAAAAWRLSDEDFLADSEVISDLKFRVSWGVTGNQAFANYQQFSDYTLGDPQAQAQFGQTFVPTIRPAAADPGIKWEETTSINVGFDFGLFEDRFTGSVEYFQQDTDDLLFTVPVPAGTNLSNFVTTNIGSLTNNGIEFELEGAIVQADNPGDFSWNALFNLFTLNNELQSINASAAGSEEILVGGIAGGVGSNIQVLRPGSPVNSFFVYEHIRDSNGNPIYADTDGNGTINELDLYVDQNDDGAIDQSDRRAFEDPFADLSLALTSFFEWKNFDASFTMRAQFGNHVYNNVASNLGHLSRLQGNAPTNLHSSVLETNFDNPQYFSDYYIQDASFLRVDNFTVGYTFSDGRFSGARLFGTIQNALTITGYEGLDPLVGIGGIDNNIFPRARTFTAGLSFGF